MADLSDEHVSVGMRNAAGPGVSQERTPLQAPAFDESAVKRLLEVVASIVADEYIEVAMSNPEVFADPESIGGKNR